MIPTLSRIRTGRLAAAVAGAVLAVSIASSSAAAMLGGPGDPAPARLTAGAVKPAAVATTSVAVPQSLLTGARGPVHFSVEAAGDVRVFGPATGVLDSGDSEEALLLLTFAVPRDQRAGPLTLANVTFELETGERWEGQIDAVVVVEARLELSLTPRATVVAPGQTMEVDYAIANLGNAADTIILELESPSGWTAERGATPISLLPGQRESGTLRVRASSSAIPGDRVLLGFVARGRNALARAQAPLEIAIPAQSPNYDLPLRVFAGAGRAPGGPGEVNGNWAVSGRGEVLDGATFSIDAHSANGMTGRSAFARELTGPTFRASLETDRWNVTGGQIFQPEDAVIGAYLNGRGASGSWAGGSVRAAATIAEVGTDGLNAGQLATASVGVATPFGDLGVAARSELRDEVSGPAQSSLHGGALTFSRGSASTLRVNANAGLVRMGDASGAAVHPTASAELHHSSSAGYLSLRARHAAEDAVAFGGRASGIFAGGALELGRGAAATAWYSRDALGRRASGTAGEVEAASAGLRLATGPVQTAVRATTSRSSLPDAAGGHTRRDAAAVDLSAAFGGAFLSLTAEHGIGSGSIADYIQGSLQWQTGRSWTSLNGTYSAPQGADPIARLDLVQTLDLGRARLELAAGGAPNRSASSTLSAWARAEVDVGRDLALLVGTEYAPIAATGSRLGFSLGVSRRLSVGLPTRRPIPVSGVAFHDLNADGERGADEPAFAGLMLRRGRTLAVTSSTGVFELGGAAGEPMTVDASSLPSGGIVAPASLRNPRQGMLIPVAQAAALRLELFFDANGNAVRDAEEQALPRAIVRLEDASGHVYLEAADEDGRIEFRAIPPGAYVARVVANAEIREAAVELHLESGTSLEAVLPVRRAEREVRFGTAPIPAPE